jgi:hypothetical protein
METSEQRIIFSIKRFLEQWFQTALTPDRIQCSLDLLRAVKDKEGVGTSFVPLVDYSLVVFLQIPRHFEYEKDQELVAQYRAKGVPEVWLKKIQPHIELRRKHEEMEFERYINSKYFELQEGETLEQLREKTMSPFFPMTWIPERAVPKRREVPLDDNGHMIYSLAAEMPRPGDAPYETQLGNYIENCMAALVDNVAVMSHSTVYFNYRIVTNEGLFAITPRIVLYLSVIHPKGMKPTKRSEGEERAS